MVCDFCQTREAVIFMEQFSGAGRKNKINICYECALERGLTPDGKNMETSFGNLLKELAGIADRIAVKDKRSCPVCGTSFSKIKTRGKTGCPECYAVFKEDLRTILAGNGVKEGFTGTMPARLSNIRSVLNDRIILQNKLNDALKDENYEKAAMYRDYLKALERTSVCGADDE